jgi:hypothetical protein
MSTSSVSRRASPQLWRIDLQALDASGQRCVPEVILHVLGSLGVQAMYHELFKGFIPFPAPILVHSYAISGEMQEDAAAGHSLFTILSFCREGRQVLRLKVVWSNRLFMPHMSVPSSLLIGVRRLTLHLLVIGCCLAH